MTDNKNTGQYSFDEVWYKLDDYYHFHPEFGKLLAKALSFLPCEDVDTVLEKALFIPYSGESWCFSQELIGGRSVVILDAKDLENEADAIVTILHEAGHAFLGHKTAVCFSVDDKEGDEDECWNQVREWLPNEFMECIACHEREGGGTIMYAIEILDDYNIWQENLVGDNNIFSTVEDAENAIAKLKTRDGWELSTYRVTEIDK